ncbi:MAG: hypothetical protein U9P82_02145 [Bacteroidota bacterium]|nr:hypothetical protein [Bacteroidota bacterium]
MSTFKLSSFWGSLHYNPNEIATKLINIQNEISVLINTTSEWIFPKLNFTEESKKLYELTKNILDLTSKFGKEFKNIIRDNSEFNQQTLLIELERIKWHNSVKNLLGKIHRMKYKLFSLIPNYLKE